MTRFFRQTSHRHTIGMLVLVGILIGGVWAWQRWRTVDGRTAAQWLAFSQHAAQTVAYRATGRTILQERPATFTLAQGEHGRYTMTVVDADGQRCVMGDDGEFAWYQTGARTVRTARVTNPPPLPASPRRIVGTATLAGRRIVRVRIQQGHSVKTLGIDRATGVVLEMITREGRRVVSHMRAEQISYEAVTVGACPADAEVALHPVTRDAAATLLGTRPVEPEWLPDGMTLRGIFREWCACCRQEMVILRYADGMRALTVFEADGAHMCAMAEGCHMAPTSGELIDSRRIGALTVIAVGNLERATLEKVMRSLR